MADHPDIEQAIRDLQSGTDREDAFRRLYETYFRPVRAFFLRRAFAHEDAEELTQETFLRVHRYVGDYAHDGRFGAWLFTVADSVCRKTWQRQRTLKRQGIDVPYDENPAPDDSGRDQPSAPRPPAEPPRQADEAYGGERRRILGAAVGELAERQRQCLTVHLRGYTYGEIGTLLQISPETVKQHLGAARKNLRRRLADVDLGPLGGAP